MGLAPRHSRACHDQRSSSFSRPPIPSCAPGTPAGTCWSPSFSPGSVGGGGCVSAEARLQRTMAPFAVHSSVSAPAAGPHPRWQCWRTVPATHLHTSCTPSAASPAATQPAYSGRAIRHPRLGEDFPGPGRPIPGPGLPPRPRRGPDAVEARRCRHCPSPPGGPGIREAVVAAPRRQARPARPVQRPSTRAFDRIEAGADVAERLKRRPFEHVETQAGEPPRCSGSGPTVRTGWPPCSRSDWFRRWCCR